MTEREQVIAELLYLKHDYLEGSASDQTLDKAIALLKAQEPKKPIVSGKRYGNYLEHCPSCGIMLPNSSDYGKSYYCYKCGQAVKWE